jgi:hypothetical protein
MVGEAHMRQLAWLDFHRGKWHLATSNAKGPIRQWIDEETALSELTLEGWTITGPFPKKRKLALDSRRMFYGFALTRAIH